MPPREPAERHAGIPAERVAHERETRGVDLPELAHVDPDAHAGRERLDLRDDPARLLEVERIRRPDDEVRGRGASRPDDPIRAHGALQPGEGIAGDAGPGASRDRVRRRASARTTDRPAPPTATSMAR